MSTVEQVASAYESVAIIKNSERLIEFVRANKAHVHRYRYELSSALENLMKIDTLYLVDGFEQRLRIAIFQIESRIKL